MPAFTPTPGTPVPNPTPPIRSHESPAVDTRRQPRHQLLTHVEGSRWIVNYYSQLLTRDGEATRQEIGRPAVYQQYLEIKDFELKVTEPLSPSFEASSAEQTYVGGATIYPMGLVPNVGDLITADIGDGRLALFHVDSIEPRSVLKDAAWAIRYSVKDYLNDTTLADLTSKISKSTVFVRDLLAIGKSPILVKSEYEIYQELLKWLTRIPSEYFSEFHNRDVQSLVIPDQTQLTYDPYVVKFVLETISQSKHPEYAQVRQLNADSGGTEQIRTIWDALMERSDHVLNYASLNMCVQSTKTRYHRPRFNTVAYGQIMAVIQPQGQSKPFGAVIRDDVEPSKPKTFIRPLDPVQTTINLEVTGAMSGQVQDGPEDTPTPTPPVIHPVGTAWYVLSSGFYLKQIATTSVLERLVGMYLRREALPHSALLQLAQLSIGWGQVERFYYLPILYVLIGSSIGDIN